MKANEAPYFPEKVYIPRDPEYPQSPNIWWERESSESNIEYTRTDAFIEKALEFLDGCIPDYIDLEHANVDTFMDVDNKRFIEDFRKYMEGE